jgi:Tfp pilus assembly PilM family ATPase
MTTAAHKKFISIYFTASRLQVVELTEDEKRVQKFFSVEVPKGLITNKKVTDVQKLAELLKNVWIKYKLKTLHVGIVVPEFSTYIKSFRLPKVERDELDEAVRWQAVDAMPASEENVVLDWKILEENQKDITVLAASIKKDVLSGYIEAAGKAGLMPLVLETPSLSLARISDHEESGKLVIYQAFDEALLLVAKGENIFGSSITSLGDENIISTALRIIQYYKNVKVQRILVSGINLTQNLFTFIANKFSVKPEWVQVGLVGMTPQQLQEYMIPLSLALKDPSEPRDETTINLLPVDWAKSYEKKRLKKRLQGLFLFSFTALSLVLTATLAMYFYLNREHKRLEGEVLSVGSSGVEDVWEESARVNKLSDKVEKITDTKTNFEEIINALTESTTNDMNLVRYEINFETMELEIVGRADTRLSLLDFKKNLDEKEIFDEVEIPLTALEKDSDIDF